MISILCSIRCVFMVYSRGYVNTNDHYFQEFYELVKHCLQHDEKSTISSLFQKVIFSNREISRSEPVDWLCWTQENLKFFKEDLFRLQLLVTAVGLFIFFERLNTIKTIEVSNSHFPSEFLAKIRISCLFQK